MAIVLPFSVFVEAFADKPREEFLERITTPFLFFPNLPDLEQSSQFKTREIKLGEKNQGVPGSRGILAVRKDGATNAFSMMITMGRAANNDLVIPDKQVSKFHAYFRQLGERWTLTDANSTNGTVVDGILLPKERSAPLHSGSLIELSDAIEVLFLLPEDLYSHLQDTRELLNEGGVTP